MGVRNILNIQSKKNLIYTLLSIIFILFGITGGLVYADQINYKYIPKEDVVEVFPESTSLTFGEYGTYKAIYDTQQNLWTVGLWEETLIIPGTKNIPNIQEDGGIIKFEMPWNGYINNNTGQIYVDGKLWNNGNPAINKKGDSDIKKGQEVEIRYTKDNQSAGFQIWFK